MTKKEFFKLLDDCPDPMIMGLPGKFYNMSKVTFYLHRDKKKYRWGEGNYIKLQSVKNYRRLEELGKKLSKWLEEYKEA